MEALCEFCGVARAIVYCKSDSARLCFNCDGFVHGANSLSCRHYRSLLCDKCHSQPASFRCLEEKLSICESCDWIHGEKCSGLGHSLEPLNWYSGKPSLDEFSKIWSSVAEVASNFKHVPKKENEGSSFGTKDQLEQWVPNQNCLPCNNKDQTLFPEDSKGFSSSFKDFEDLCDSLNMEDIEFNWENGNDIFGCSQLLADVKDCIKMDKNLSITESNVPVDNAIEGSSTLEKQECKTFQTQSSQVIGSSASLIEGIDGNNPHNSLIMNSISSRNINDGIPSNIGTVPSISISNITGESSVTDYQDCVLSPMFMSPESPWEFNVEISNPQARHKAKIRYNEKKKTRTFGKQIRYATRKARADSRKRVKGRFVKAGEAYDYDPLDTPNL